MTNENVTLTVTTPETVETVETEGIRRFTFPNVLDTPTGSVTVEVIGGGLDTFFPFSPLYIKGSRNPYRGYTLEGVDSVDVNRGTIQWSRYNRSGRPLPVRCMWEGIGSYSVTEYNGPINRKPVTGTDRYHRVWTDGETTIRLDVEPDGEGSLFIVTVSGLTLRETVETIEEPTPETVETVETIEEPTPETVETVETLVLDTVPLDSFPLSRLRTMVKERGVKGHSKSDKDTLIKVLTTEGETIEV